MGEQLTLSQRDASLREVERGSLAVGRAATPRGDRLGSRVHAWRLGGWPVAQGPGRTPEVCLLLRAGASERTPEEPGGGAGVAEHQGAPPMQQELW